MFAAPSHLQLSADFSGPMASPPPTAELRVHPATFRTAALLAVQNVLFLLRIAKWKVAYHSGKNFSRNEQLPYFSRVPDEDIAQSLSSVVDETFSAPEDAELNALAKDVLTRLDKAYSIPTIIAVLGEVEELNTRGLESLGGRRFSVFSPSPGSSVAATPALSPAFSKMNLSLINAKLSDQSADGTQSASGIDSPKSYFSLSALPTSYFSFNVISNPERLSVSWPEEYGPDFLKATTRIAQALRDEKRDPSFVDYIAFHLGYQMLNQGQNPFNPLEARFLGTVGFRKDTQTYVSLTDPGDGHVFGTTRKTRWMRGAIVHVEHLERPQNLPRDSIESYRIPSILDFARTRLHTGSESPNTYFVGRALRDSKDRTFEHDFIKVVNTTSSAATAAFQLGAAECKVAMDDLTASQMIAYMRSLAGHALRNHRQYFSAAFNLNTPLIDDLNLNAEGKPTIITEQVAIGRRGVELAALGGFDKVTWDGASDTYPSQCIILQLGFQNALELVHKAHSVGLTTYMSAGFKFAQIHDAVVSGVDGIGIGGAQILRYMDGRTGMHGPYTEEFIDKICVARDNAANSIRGRGVALLARLDQMHFEGSLTAAEEEIREPLYQALYEVQEDELHAILEDSPAAQGILSIPHDGERPWTGRARRILRHPDPLLRNGARVMTDGEERWADFVKSLASLVDECDEYGIYSYSLCEPWKSFRRNYRISVGESPIVQGETRVGLKITPLSKPL